MGAIRRWRILIVVFVTWALFCWFAWGPQAGVLSSARIPFIKPRPQPEGARTGDIRFLKRPERYPVSTLVSIPQGDRTIKLAKIQAKQPHEEPKARAVRLARLDAVRESFQHSWDGYREHAWLRDEVAPLTGKARDPFGGWAATLVDALDSLYIFGLEAEFKNAVAACDKIDFTAGTSHSINVFETTIRYLGGFLAAYELSGSRYPILLKKAVEVGSLLMEAFDTPNRLPVTRWDWKEYVRGGQQVAGSETIVSEIGSLSLEFTKLSELTGDMRYYDAVKRISDAFELGQDQTSLPGMWPIIIDAAAPSFHTFNGFTVGGMADSLYEYLPKQYLLLGGRLDQTKKMYEKFIAVAKKHIFWRAVNRGNHDILIAADVEAAHVDDKATFSYKYRGQHLGCFAGGMVGLASRAFDRPEDLDIAARLTQGCVWAYNATKLGVCPELFTFMPCGRHNETGGCDWDEARWRRAVGERWGTKAADNEEEGISLKQQIDAAIVGQKLGPGFVDVEDRRYILRPEAIESVFIMYRLTGDAAWMDTAWDMFQRIEKLTRTPIAAAAIFDVTAPTATQVDSMESFWLAETLKYFGLVFSEWQVVSLDEWVLNTEAHPLRRMSSSGK